MRLDQYFPFLVAELTGLGREPIKATSTLWMDHPPL
jgi:hypothetical protein